MAQSVVRFEVVGVRFGRNKGPELVMLKVVVMKVSGDTTPCRMNGWGAGIESAATMNPSLPPPSLLPTQDLHYHQT